MEGIIETVDRINALGLQMEEAALRVMRVLEQMEEIEKMMEEKDES